MEDTRGAVAPSNPTTIASFTCTGADGKPVGIDAFAGDFALIAFGRAKDHELSASKLMRLRDVIAQSGAPARVPPSRRARGCLRAHAQARRPHARLSELTLAYRLLNAQWVAYCMKKAYLGRQTSTPSARSRSTEL